jgi:hypothetical protein
MKRNFPIRLLPLLLPAVLLCGCNSLRQKEQLMSASGFRTVVPSTAAQAAHLQSLPQGRLTPVVKKGKTVFMLADAKRNCLYVGNQSQYQAYQQLRLRNQIAQDKLATASLNADADNEWAAWGGIDTPLW